MPSLKFIIGADASPFAQAMAIVATSGTSAGNRTMSEFKKAAAEIEKSRVAMAEIGGNTTFLDHALARVHGQMSTLERDTWAAKAASDALAESYARVRLGQGSDADRLAVRGVPRGMSETDFDKSMLSGSQVTRTTNNATAIEAKRAEIAAKKARDADLATSLTGSQVTRKGPMEDQLRRLRAQMTGGDSAQVAAARKEIQMLVATRAASNPSAGGGFKRGMGQFGVAGSMFTSVARDSAASLASGAPITQIIAQQAPQVLQALTMMRIGLMTLLKWVLPLGALATGLFLVWRHFAKIAEAARNLAGLKDVTIQFGTMADAMDKSRDASEKLRNELWDMADAQKNVKNSIDETISALEEQHRVELEIMRNKGASNAELAKKKLEQDRAMLKSTEEAIKKADAEFKMREKFSKANTKAANDPAEVAKLDTLKKKRDEMTQVVEDAEKALKKTPAPVDPFGGGSLLSPEEEEAQRSRQVLEFESGGLTQTMSVETAKAMRAELDRQYQEQQSKVGDRTRLAGMSGQSLSESSKQVETLTKEADSLRTSIRRQEKILPSIDDKKGGGGYSQELTSNQKIGAYASGPQLNMLDVANKQLNELRQINTKLGGSASGKAFKPGGMGI